MKRLTRIAVGAGAILGFSAFAAPATAGADGPVGPIFGFGANHAVFVQTDNLSGNQVVAYDRAADGTGSGASASSRPPRWSTSNRRTRCLSPSPSTRWATSSSPMPAAMR